MLAAVWGQPRPPTGDSGLPPRCSAEKSNHNEYLKINTLSTEIKVKNSSIQNKFYTNLRFGLIHHLIFQSRLINYQLKKKVFVQADLCNVNVS